ITGGHGALVDDDGLGLVGLEDRHAGDRRLRIGLGRRVDHVVGTQNQNHVGLAEFAVDVFHLEDLLVGHFGLGQQDVHVARHTTGNRVDRVLHGDATLGQLFGQLHQRVLGTGHGQAVTGDDHHGVGVGQQEGGVVGGTGLHAALDLLATG